MIKRTICSLSLSFLLGNYFVSQIRWQALALFLLLLGCLGVGLFAIREQIGVGAAVRLLLCIALFLTGAVRAYGMETVRIELEEALSEGTGITVLGQVSRKEEQISLKPQRERQYIYYLTDTQVLWENRVFSSYGILIYSSNGQYQPGNLLKIDGRYAPFQISRNQGNFNEKQYYQSKKWEFRVYAESEEQISAKENSYLLFLRRLRQSFASVFEKTMNEEDAGVMANLSLGEKNMMQPEIKELYQKAGISHILAISGLHVSLLGMGALKLLKKLSCPQKIAALSAVGVVYSFGLLSGMEVSTGRAAGMFVLMMLAQILGYSYDSLTALSFMAMVQLWENPFLLENVGFLFSYSAVLGVTIAAKIINDVRMERKLEQQKKQVKDKKSMGKADCNQNCLWIQKSKAFIEDMCKHVRHGIQDTLLVSFCIQLATLPLALYFYYEISSYSIFVNLIILPFLGILLFLGIFGGLLGIVHPVLGELILTPAGWMLAINKAVCRGFLKLPAAVFIAGKPELKWLFLFYGSLLFCLYLIWRRRKMRYFIGVAPTILCLLFVRGQPKFEINMLDVGQGDGCLIQTDAGENFFVDGGSSDITQVGKYRILPFLKSKGVRSVRGWVVSHADADHISGLIEILQQGYPVETLILAEGMVRDLAAEQLVETARQADCKILYVRPGMQFGTKDTKFTVLSPQGEKGLFDMETDRNANSLVVAVKHQEFTGIFTGDIGTEQEQNLLEMGLLERYGISEIDFYKAAHHGSNGSSSQAFLEALSPAMTVISCGEKNTYGHPGKEALERIRGTGSRIFCTMQQGQIWIRPQRDGIRVWTYLP